MDDRVAQGLLVAKVLIADGIMTEEERAFLHRFLDDLGLEGAPRQQVIELEGLEAAEGVVASFSSERKQALADQLSGAALVDGQLSPHELEAVKRITAALGL